MLLLTDFSTNSADSRLQISEKRLKCYDICLADGPLNGARLFFTIINNEIKRLRVNVVKKTLNFIVKTEQSQ
jgi:hypothetical protein